MGGPVELTGPDLAAGAALGDVPEGGVLAGHAHGKPVVVARRNGRLYAVGGTCSHYSGPLGDGILVGDTIRCPWHHACFDLRTGAPQAPAFNAIPCYSVHQAGDRFTVGGEVTIAPPAPRPAPERVVIIGAGPAGGMCAESLRRLGHTGEITLVGAEATPPVDRTNLSKDYLAGNAPEAWMELRGRDYYAQQRIDFRSGTKAIAIDRGARTVTLEGGATLPWDALVLATGAEPIRLSIPGAEQLRYVRTLADSKAIIAAAGAARRAVVIGSSFIGLEVAAALRTRGLEVTVVGPDQRPLAKVLGPQLSDLVRAVHEGKGVRFQLGRKPASIAAGQVTLDDGTRLDADLVVAGVGVRPRLELVEQAGLPVDRGAVVDAQLRAAPDVYAIGDIARWPDPRSGEAVRIEHWVVAQRHGEQAARAIVGATALPRKAPFFWSAHFDLTINYVGHAPSWDRAVVDGDPGARDAAVSYHRGDKLLAVATVGRDRFALEMAGRFETEN